MTAEVDEWIERQIDTYLRVNTEGTQEDIVFFAAQRARVDKETPSYLLWLLDNNKVGIQVEASSFNYAIYRVLCAKFGFKTVFFREKY